MSYRRKKSFVDVVIDLTPLIDVVFILLIFILLSTTFLNKTAFKIKLPEVTQTANVNKEKRVIHIFINKAGDYWIEQLNTQVSFANHKVLQKQILYLSKKTPNATIKVFADATVAYQAIMTLLDILNQAGYKNINLVNQPKK